MAREALASHFTFDVDARSQVQPIIACDYGIVVFDRSSEHGGRDFKYGRTRFFHSICKSCSVKSQDYLEGFIPPIDQRSKDHVPARHVTTCNSSFIHASRYCPT